MLNKESVRELVLWFGLQMSAKWFFKFPMLVKVPMSGFMGKSDDVVTFELLEKFRQWDFYKSDDVVHFDGMLSKSDDVVVF